MIRVDRTVVPAPKVLVDEDGKGPAETAKVLASLRAWKRLPKKGRKAWKYEFSVYKDPSIKAPLEQLFHGKCAYCESPYGPTQPMDVEHWRPKSRYYWLAATWENLLPSCIDCNRKRKHVDALTGEERSIGKSDQFPIEPGSDHAAAPGRETGERPLLINPCEEDPHGYLRFADSAVVQPVEPTGAAEAKARASIDVYALNRNNLVHARKEHLRQAKLRLARVQRLERLLEEDLPEHVLVVLDELLFVELRELARMLRDDQPYALQSRQLVEQWMDDLVGGTVPRAALATPKEPGSPE